MMASAIERLSLKTKVFNKLLPLLKKVVGVRAMTSHQGVPFQHTSVYLINVMCSASALLFL
jgi:hypothetical protein